MSNKNYMNENSNEDNINLKLRLTSENHTIYDLAYILVDINQLLIISKLTELEYFDKINHYFLEGRFLTRDSSIMKFSDKYEIVDIKKNCIELVISGMSLTATVIFGIVNLYLKRSERIKNEKNEKIFFSIDKDIFDKVSNIINEHHEINELNNLDGLIKKLRLYGYFTDIKERDFFIITESIEKTVKRMVKIVYPNRKP